METALLAAIIVVAAVIFFALTRSRRRTSKGHPSHGGRAASGRIKSDERD